MAKNGFKIFDSDTHIGPHADVLEGYLSESEKRRLDSWEPWKFVDPRNGHTMYTRYARKFLRKLGSAEPEKEHKRTSRDRAVRKYSRRRRCRDLRRRSIRRNASRT